MANSNKHAVKSAAIVSSRDKAMDEHTSGGLQPGISIQNGPVDSPQNGRSTNGESNGRRKSRTSLTQKKTYKEMTSSDEDDEPLSKRRKTAVEEDSSDDDVPLAKKALKKLPKPSASQIGEKDTKVPIKKRLIEQKAQIEKKAEVTAKKIRAEDSKATKKRKVKDESDSDDDRPLAKSAKTKKTANGTKSTVSKTKVKAEASPVKKGKGKAVSTDDDADEEEENRWWENMNNDTSVKWKTLEHNGVLLAPEYVPLPRDVKLIYKEEPVTLDVQAEEVAGFYGAMLNSTVNVSNATFNKNFFSDFKKIVSKTGHAKNSKGEVVKIEHFKDCDFTKIFEYYDAERERKKAIPSADKKAIKAKKDEIEQPYMFCKWNGIKEKVGNFRVEPPGLFRGRGEHPKTGHVKTRVKPEQITINIGKGAKVPPPPPGHKWKEVKHDDTATWLAMWQENINGNHKYVMLAANSAIKGQSDYKKFEKARELKKHIDRIRKDYTKDLKVESMADRQRATAIYLIDKLALRAGNEKGDDEAETVGCCSLKFEHVTLRLPKTLVFDFLGKDSIRFHQEVEVDPQVFKNMKIFKKAPKTKGDDIFDRLNTAGLNKHLATYMTGLTAKVFRTYNASWTMATLLKEMKPTGTVPERVKEYNDANRTVAILCNHKRTVGAAHDTQMTKMLEKIKGLRYEQWRTRMMMLNLEPKLKKSRGAEYFERPEDLDDEWVEQHQAAEVEEKRQKIQKKFENDNKKREENGEKPLPEKELKERLEDADELAKKYRKENKSKKVEPEGKGPTVEKLEATYDKLEQRIENAKLQADDKEENKEVALGTSKINYIDPRLTVVFVKKFNVPIERFFSKTLREKFDWAIKSVDEDWEF
ncbi:DNA topoisomerase 1 [Microthyrium microscopicum]|uniref:DNA topoisomerase I n=1 Tax=Microthyrium microscopicum TaxID=703497 RepID=A0A6A6UUC7_9PEZI|nr:DNA topoisomerase 1 [Microthyrium microscopicum]